MERIKKESVALTPSATDSIEFTIPAGFRRWSIHVVPVADDDDAGLTDSPPDASILYWVGSAFRAVAGSSAAATALNKATVISREDSISRIRVDLSNGSTPPDAECVVELYGTR